MRMEDWPAPTMANWLARAKRTQIEVFGGDPANLPPVEKLEWTRNMVLGLVVEATEVLGEVKAWKWWRPGQAEFDREAYITELVDVVKFAGALAVAVDCTDAEWNQAWAAKDAINAARAERAREGW
jgi:dimeric dUTPase (all-alpha-NTP-PPase superfamily)